MANKIRDKPKSINELIKIGSDIAGGAAGAAIGFFAAGTGGAILGGVSGPLIKHTFLSIAAEVKQRILGRREEMRVGATITFAAVKIRENISNGQQIRQDGFFQKQPNERATGEEILEGVLLVAQREHEEKKLQFYGNLFANIAFRPDIDRAQANLLIRLGERISYRQICLLTLFENKHKFSLRQDDYRKAESIDGATLTLLQEIYELYSQGMINASDNTLLCLEDVLPRMMNVQGTGAMLYNLMELEKVNTQDLNEVAMLLR